MNLKSSLFADNLIVSLQQPLNPFEIGKFGPVIIYTVTSMAPPPRKRQGRSGGSRRRKPKKQRTTGGRKIMPPLDYKPPYPSSCYREGPKLDVVKFPRMDEIEPYLKCSRCHRLSPPGSLQCTLGHIICPRCLEKVPCCPKLIFYPDLPKKRSPPAICKRRFSSSSPHWAHSLFFEEINQSKKQSRKFPCIIL